MRNSVNLWNDAKRAEHLQEENRDMTMNRIVPVILCGGSGTRLWPLSRDLYPKQFMNLGDGRTLFGDALTRATKATDNAAPLIVCNEAYRFYVSAALAERGLSASIVLETEPRNTAPAIALAAFALSGDDPLMLILPSDQTIEDEQIFCEGVQQATAVAEKGYIATFGIIPTAAETGFGYMEQGTSLGEGAYRVARFVEKPDSATAQAMLAQGSFVWNSGMFLLRASTYLRELERYAPDIFAACRKAWMTRQPDGAFCRPASDAFLASPANSIDYAIMEHTDRAALVPLQLHWSDLGSWEAFYQAGPHDENGNVCVGDVFIEDATNNYLNSGERLVAAVGVKDMAVVATKDAVFVAPRNRVQEVKKIVERLKEKKRPECEHHPLVYRPWGSYETLALGIRFQVKRITVNPGAELSLQMHHHRAEHWVVVSGTAEISNGNDVGIYTENQSTYIPVGCHHRLKNPGLIPLVLIEVQSGSYLGEDDIIRVEDNYGRK
ncbi:mannose-1-phosphate guanylyltransferase/mannose-6-phosphate isomerase [Desulfovibrio sp. 6_1_46AFAA]|nr:mannose-1-phosphate guanylyltransferase/mannose-6-phosphate isomerase [Desulfovibrio sp. 6_1_46AFAA]